MPREIVYDDAAMYDVVISWSPGKYVQVGIGTHDRIPIVQKLGLGKRVAPETETLLSPDEMQAILRELDDTRDRVGPGPQVLSQGGDGAQFTELWGTMNRENINQLIRVLRRARNSAYGADE